MSFVKSVDNEKFAATREGYFFALSRRESSSNLKLADHHKLNVGFTFYR